MGIGTQAAIVGVIPRVSFARTGAERFAVISIAALLAADQALQQIPCSALALPGMLAIFRQLLGHCHKEGFLHQGRHRNANPLLRIDIPWQGLVSGLRQFAPQGA